MLVDEATAWSTLFFGQALDFRLWRALLPQLIFPQAFLVERSMRGCFILVGKSEVILPSTLRSRCSWPLETGLATNLLRTCRNGDFAAIRQMISRQVAEESAFRTSLTMSVVSRVFLSAVLRELRGVVLIALWLNYSSSMTKARM